MDAFYASATLAQYPPNDPIHSRPVAIGSENMLSTCNYVARTFGVRSGMPGFKARALCQDLVVLKSDFALYRRISDVVMNEVLALYDPDLHVLGMDECFVDLSVYMSTHPDETVDDVVRMMRADVKQKTGLTCSAGIAPTRALAKVCSDRQKPDGQYSLLPCTPESYRSFVSALEVGQISGIGKVMEKTLRALGIRTCGQLLDQRVMLSELYAPKTFDFLLRCSLGLSSDVLEDDDSDGETKSHRKSISVERTFNALSTHEGLYNKLEEIVSRLVGDILKHFDHPETDSSGRWMQVTLKAKTVEFDVLNRTRRLETGLGLDNKADHYDILVHDASVLLKSLMPISLRLMGVRVSSFEVTSPESVSLMKFVKVIQQPTEADEQFRCLICQQLVRECLISNDLDERNSRFNRHLDLCLNRRGSCVCRCDA
jgi:DNA polymerase kappa